MIDHPGDLPANIPPGLHVVSGVSAPGQGMIVPEGADSEGFLVRLIRRTWIGLFLAAVVSGVGAYYWANKKAVTTHEIESRLSFHRTSFGSPLYLGPDIHSLAAEFESYVSLETLRERAGLKFPAQLISQRLKTNVTRGNGSLDLTFTWENPEDGKMILGKLIEVGVERCRQIRDSEIDEHTSALVQTTKQVYEPQLEAIERDYLALSNQYGVVDIVEASQDVEQQIKSLAEELRRERLDRVAITDHLNALQNQSLTLVNFEAFNQPGQGELYRSFKHDSAGTNLTSPIADGLIRDKGSETITITANREPVDFSSEDPALLMDRMEDLKKTIVEERDEAMAEAKLKRQEEELERLRVLVEKNLTPKSRYVSLLAEVEQLRLAVVGNDPVRSMKAELVKLEEKIKAYGPELVATVDAARKRSELESDLQRQIISTDSHISQLQALIEEKQPELDVLESVLPQAMDILDQKDVLEEKLKQQTTLSEGLQNLKRSEANAFSVTTAPTVNVSRQSSTWRKQFAISFLALFVALSLPVSAVGLKGILPSESGQLARRYRIPLLASIEPKELQSLRSGDDVAIPSLKLLAVHIRQLVGSDGSALHFVGLGERETTARMVEELAKCLAACGEETSVIMAEPVATALSTDDNSTTVVAGEPIESSGLSIGIDQSQVAERLLHRFSVEPGDVNSIRRLIESGTARGLVLVAGIDIKDRAEVELVSLLSSGVILCSPAHEKLARSADDLVASLVRYHAPVIGIID